MLSIFWVIDVPGKAMKPLLALCAILAGAGCASSSPMSGSCDPPCQDWQECIDGICAPTACCPDAPPGEIWYSISGKILDITTMQGVRASICLYSPMDALTGDDPTCIPDQCCWESDEDGNFFIPCQPYPEEVALGCMTMMDDPEWDGNGGRLFPTGSGGCGWDTDNGDPCVYDARHYALPNTLVAALDAETSTDSAGYGFVMGYVVDSSGNPVAGAVIKKGDGSDLVEVIYPDATFTTFDGTATAESGFFVLPHTNFAGGITEIVAEKNGMTFGAEKAAPKAGFCYFVYILAN